MRGIMFKNKFRIIIFALFILQMASVCFSREQNIYHSPAGHFSFVIPEGWHKIPNETIEEHFRLGDQFTHRVSKRPEAAFQKINDKYFKKPFMTLMVREIGDPLQVRREFKMYLQGREDKKAKEKLKGKPNMSFRDLILASEFQDSSPGPIIYDTVRNMLITKFASYPTFKDSGKILFINIQIPASYGIIEIYFQTTEKTLNDDLAYFSQIIDSFNIDENYRYPGVIG